MVENQDTDEKRRLAIIMHSGSYDRIHQTFSIARAAIANEMEVHIFFSFWALRRLVKGEMDKLTLDEENNKFIPIIEENLKKTKTETPSQMLSSARKMGTLKIYACSASMGLLGIRKEDLISEVDRTMGFVSFLALSEDATISYYI